METETGGERPEQKVSVAAGRRARLALMSISLGYKLHNCTLSRHAPLLFAEASRL